MLHVHASVNMHNLANHHCCAGHFQVVFSFLLQASCAPPFFSASPVSSSVSIHFEPFPPPVLSGVRVLRRAFKDNTGAFQRLCTSSFI